MENVTLQVTDEAIRAMARIAAQVNRLVENIGARRLHTVIERVMGDISFEAADMPPGSTVCGGAVASRAAAGLTARGTIAHARRWWWTPRTWRPSWQPC